VMRPSLKIWAESLLESHSRAPPRWTWPGPHAAGGRPPDTVTGPDSGGQAGESPGSGDDCSPAWSKTAKGDLAVKHRRGIQTRSRGRCRVPRPPELSMPPFRQARLAGHAIARCDQVVTVDQPLHGRACRGTSQWPACRSSRHLLRASGRGDSPQIASRSPGSGDGFSPSRW
jgi:hypothetical protein